jgi:hypothetical protein
MFLTNASLRRFLVTTGANGNFTLFPQFPKLNGEHLSGKLVDSRLSAQV